MRVVVVVEEGGGGRGGRCSLRALSEKVLIIHGKVEEITLAVEKVGL